MNFDQFNSSILNDTPYQGISPLLKVMWLDAKGDWHGAHDIAQDIHDRNGSWIHAYLHRKEGDLANARYWYQKAGKNEPAVSLEEEWKILVSAFL